MDRGFRAALKYRSDEFLSGGAGKQLLLLFVLSIAIVLVHTAVAMVLALHVGEGFFDTFWFYFTRILDAGTMGGDEGPGVRIVSTVDTVLGVIVAGLLISSLAGNFQERLESIKRGGSPVIEHGHFLILGWSEKIYSVIDQISEAYISQGKIVVVVMAERDKIEMEENLRDKVVHQDRMKLVVRSGNSQSLHDLSRVAFDQAQAIVVLIDETDVSDPSRADGRITKTLMALFNHPDVQGRADNLRVTAEVMLAVNQEIAEIASNGAAQVICTNAIISKIILQTARISGLSLVYDELLRFEGNEVHFKNFPVAGKRFGDILLDFPNGCVLGVAKRDGSGHTLNPPPSYQMQPDEELLILAEDANVVHQPYQGTPPVVRSGLAAPPANKPVEHMLILGWNEKVFPIVQEFDNYVGPGSTLTMVNKMAEESRARALRTQCGDFKNVNVRHLVGEFTSRKLMEQVQPHRYPTVMVLGDAVDAQDAEAADTRAIIALLLLRDFRKRAGIDRQEVCSEILDPKNRELAATTEIHDIVISNEMVSMVLAQITYEPRVRAVLEDLFESDGSEIYLKPISFYAPLGQPTNFEELIVAANARNEAALGLQILVKDPSKKYGMVLNPTDRKTPFVPKAGDRLIVLAEDDG